MAETPSPQLVGPAIACVRCRQRKKKCDQAVPTCGECERIGVECLRFQERKPRESASVPWEYVKELETRLMAMEKTLSECVRASELSMLVMSILNTSSGSTENVNPKSKFHDAHELGLEHESMDSMPAEGAYDPPVEAGQQHIDTGMEMTTRSLEISYPEAEGPQYDETRLLRGSDLSNYISFVHPIWPFMSSEILATWFEEAVTEIASTPSHHLYFVQMACAIGGCLASSSDVGCSHINRARKLSYDATTNHLSKVVSKSPTLRTKAYLMQVVFAFHFPGEFKLYDGLKEAILQLKESLVTRASPNEDYWVPSTTRQDDLNAQGQSTRSLMIQSYSTLEIIAILWNPPFSELMVSLDQSVWQQGVWLTFECGAVGVDLEHMFAIRRLQTQIRKFWELYAISDDQDTKGRQIARIKAELDQWRAMIPLVTTCADSALSYHPLSMLKVYDYCVCSLYQNEHIVPCDADYDCLLSAAGENSRCFRRIQEQWPVIYSTWGGLHEQFSVSIILLACFWGVPYSHRTPNFQAPHTIQALEDSEVTLARFAQRWEAAGVYLEAFKLLLSCTPTSPPLNTSFEVPTRVQERGRELIGILRDRNVARSIIVLMERIVYR